MSNKMKLQRLLIDETFDDENRPYMLNHFRTAWNSLSATTQRTRILSNGDQARIGNSSQGATEAVSRIAESMGIEGE